MSDIYEDVAQRLARDGKAIRMTEPSAGHEAWLQHLREVRASIARNRDRLVREAEGLTANLARWDRLIADQEASPTIPAPGLSGDPPHARADALLSGQQRTVPGADPGPSAAPGGNEADR